jgi:hypothetical protein
MVFDLWTKQGLGQVAIVPAFLSGNLVDATLRRSGRAIVGRRTVVLAC